MSDAFTSNDSGSAVNAINITRDSDRASLFLTQDIRLFISKPIISSGLTSDKILTNTVDGLVNKTLTLYTSALATLESNSALVISLCQFSMNDTPDKDIIENDSRIYTEFTTTIDKSLGGLILYEVKISETETKIIFINVDDLTTVSTGVVSYSGYLPISSREDVNTWLITKSIKDLSSPGIRKYVINKDVESKEYTLTLQNYVASNIIFSEGVANPAGLFYNPLTDTLRIEAKRINLVHTDGISDVTIESITSDSNLIEFDMEEEINNWLTDPLQNDPFFGITGKVNLMTTASLIVNQSGVFLSTVTRTDTEGTITEQVYETVKFETTPPVWAGILMRNGNGFYEVATPAKVMSLPSHDIFSQTAELRIEMSHSEVTDMINLGKNYSLKISGTCYNQLMVLTPVETTNLLLSGTGTVSKIIVFQTTDGSIQIVDEDIATGVTYNEDVIFQPIPNMDRVVIGFATFMDSKLQSMKLRYVNGHKHYHEECINPLTTTLRCKNVLIVGYDNGVIEAYLKATLLSSSALETICNFSNSEHASALIDKPVGSEIVKINLGTFAKYNFGQSRLVKSEVIPNITSGAKYLVPNFTISPNVMVISERRVGYPQGHIYLAFDERMTQHLKVDANSNNYLYDMVIEL